MKYSIIFLLTLGPVLAATAYGQTIVANTCDSSLLTAKAYEKCKADTAWTADLLIKTNYIINFKTALLPKYLLIRQDLDIPPTLQKSLRKLKNHYDKVLMQKLRTFEMEMDRNQKYVQPKAYLSSLLSIQVLKFYPDIYAVLLNNIHLQLSPKTTKEAKRRYQRLFDQCLKAIPTDLYQMLTKTTGELNKDNEKLFG